MNKCKRNDIHSEMVFTAFELAYVARIISQSLWPVFTGFVHPSESRSSSRLSSTAPCMAQLLATCRINCIESPTCHREVGWGQRLATDLTSWLVTAGDRLFASAGPRSGTVSLKTSHLLNHCQCFDVNWRITCFGTRTLYWHCYCTIVIPWSFFYYRPL